MHYLFSLVNLALEAYVLVIIARSLISWVSPDPSNPVVRFLYRATEPVLRPIRRHMPNLGGLDLSPVVAIVGIIIIQKVLSSLAYQLG